MRAKQAARPQNNIGGLRVDLRLRQQPLLGGVLAGGIVVGEAPGAITLIKIVMRLKIEVDCRRGDMHEAPHAAAPGRLRQLVRRCGVDAVKFRFAAPGRRLGRTVPHPLAVGHQLPALLRRGLRQIERVKFGAQLTQRFAGQLIAAGGAHLMPGLQQPLRRVAPQPAGRPAHQHPHGSNTMPASASPAAVPISITGCPGLKRPVVTAACSAVGIEAATWLP